MILYCTTHFNASSYFVAQIEGSSLLRCYAPSVYLGPLKIRLALTNRHGITCHNNWIFINTLWKPQTSQCLWSTLTSDLVTVKYISLSLISLIFETTVLILSLNEITLTEKHVKIRFVFSLNIRSHKGKTYDWWNKLRNLDGLCVLKNSFKLARALAPQITNVNYILFKNELYYHSHCIYPVRWHQRSVFCIQSACYFLFTIRTI